MVKQATPEVTDSLLRLLFARFVGPISEGVLTAKSGPPPVAASGGKSGRPSVPELRQVIGHLVRIAHTDVMLPTARSAPHAGTGSACGMQLAAPQAPAASGLLEKMDSSTYQRKTSHGRRAHQFGKHSLELVFGVGAALYTTFRISLACLMKFCGNFLFV